MRYRRREQTGRVGTRNAARAGPGPNGAAVPLGRGAAAQLRPGRRALADGRADRHRGRVLAARDAGGRIRAAARRSASRGCGRERRRREADVAEDGSGIYYLDVLVHRASLPESWLSRFEDGATVLPADAVVPPGGDPADLDRVDRLTFADSRTVAGVVALRALGRKVTVERTGVTFDGVDRTAPSYRAGLRPGMVISAIDDVAVPQLKDLETQMKGRQPGSPIHLSVLDGKKKLDIRTKLTSDPDNKGRAIIGVLGVHDAPPRAQLPVKVTISPRGLGRGPSAGLAFALQVYDALSGHRLANGRKIAVTGTIDLERRCRPDRRRAPEGAGRGRASAPTWCSSRSPTRPTARLPRRAASRSSASRASARR